MAEPQRDIARELRAVRLSTLDKADRRRLLDAYERSVYNPAFPNAEIREDPAYWLALLEADPYPPPPQPRLEVILVVCADDRVAGGATVEHYRNADCGLLTYLSVAMCVVLALFTFFKPASALGAIEYVNRIGAVFAALGALEIARQVWRRRSRLESRPDDTILQSLQAYRAELQRRRDYYFDTWRWSIWPILPCMGTIIIGGLIYNNRPGAGRVYALVTAISILAIAVGIWHYRRKGLDLQRELDALDTMKRD